MSNTIGTKVVSSTYSVGGESISIKDSNGDQVADKIKVTDANGTTTDWQDLDPATRANLEAGLLNNFGVGIEDSGNGETFVNLDPAQRGQLSSVISAITDSSANLNEIQGRWADFVSGLKLNGSQDVNALVQQVLRESYMESTQDLAFYAQKVKFYNNLKKDIRDQLTEMRNQLANNAGADEGEKFTITLTGEPGTDQATDKLKMWAGDPGLEDGVLVSKKETSPKNALQNSGVTANADGSVTVEVTKDQLDTFVQNLEERLNSVGDDSQLANVDLQNMLQKQQQTLQMMSNISKMLNDTALSVIRKLG